MNTDRFKGTLNTFDDLDLDPSHRPLTEEERRFYIECYGRNAGGSPLESRLDRVRRHPPEDEEEAS